MRGIWLIALLLLPGAQALTIMAGPVDSISSLAPESTMAGTMAVTIRCDSKMDALDGPAGVVYTSDADDGITLDHQQYFPLATQMCLDVDEVEFQVAYNLTAGPDAPGEMPLISHHSFSVVDDSGAPVTPEVTAETQTTVAWNGSIEMTAPTAYKQAGPQQQIEFDVEITYTGNALAEIRFDIEADYDSNGRVIEPAPIVMEPGQTQVVQVVYSTPFQNGENSALQNFTLTAWPQSTKDPDDRGEEVSKMFQAETQGLYVPGPGIALVLAPMAAALLRRRG